ncbi:MAG: hypothetical protein EA381_19375 [Planctomycetaceae bacterium]|nr:MAG: hypothetical protein EA381_19375 [Planctomycetaceae bacterium]
MPAGADLELDPLVGLDNPRMPLRSKVLAVPEFRRQYLENLRTLAEKSMTWEAVAPVVASYRELVAEEVAAETRKLGTLEAFLNATSDSTASDDTTSDRATSSDAERAGRETAATEPAPAFGPPRFGPRQVPIREFMETRSRYLLRRTAELLAESPAESPANGEGQRP